ncbi:Bug family tripartite tricarboxylate transporter substrate binding protein [Arthrobacter pigmenti]
MRKLAVLCSAALALTLSGCGSSAQQGNAEAAESYPERPIQLIVPWSAGGDTDAIYRLVAQELEKELDGTVVVKNISGGGGTVGAQQALAAEGDGYTLLAGHDSIAISKILGKTDFGYFDFAPVAQMTSTYDFVATPAGSPWDDMKDVIQDSKADPGSISFGASLGSTSQLEPLLVAGATDVKFNVVGYEGTAERMQALVGDHVDLGGVSVVAGKEYLDAGKLKLLGYFGEERSEVVPDVPTLKEQGIDVSTATNRGVFAPEGTPDAIIKKVSNALQKVANSDVFTTKMKNLGTEVNFKDTKEYKQFLKGNTSEIEKAMKKAGMV